MDPVAITLGVIELVTLTRRVIANIQKLQDDRRNPLAMADSLETELRTFEDVLCRAETSLSTPKPERRQWSERAFERALSGPQLGYMTSTLDELLSAIERQRTEYHEDATLQDGISRLEEFSRIFERAIRRSKVSRSSFDWLSRLEKKDPTESPYYNPRRIAINLPLQEGQDTTSSSTNHINIPNQTHVYRAGAAKKPKYSSRGLIALAMAGSTSMNIWGFLHRAGKGDRVESAEPGSGVPSVLDAPFGPILGSPATLVVAIVGTTASLTGYHYLHREDKQQNMLIITFVGAGVLVGGLAGLDGIGILLYVIPWCVLVAMILSAYTAESQSDSDERERPSEKPALGSSLHV